MNRLSNFTFYTDINFSLLCSISWSSPSEKSADGGGWIEHSMLSLYSVPSRCSYLIASYRRDEAVSDA